MANQGIAMAPDRSCCLEPITKVEWGNKAQWVIKPTT